MRQVQIADLPVGSIMAVSAASCVARFAEDEVKAFGRHCPHSGSDLALGWVKDHKIVCPWHNLPFDATTRSSACKALRPLIGYECEVRDGLIHVGSRLPGADGDS